MFIEKVKSQGLAHLSYVIGGSGEAAVVDPRRDVACYLDIAAGQNCRITHVFETHRNEDLVSGAALLAARTGATVFHGPEPAGEVRYAEGCREGESFTIGNVRLEVLETPGHTDDSISLAIFDPAFGAEAVGVFTGDALFVGDVGRTDFYPQRAREVAGALFDSLQKLLALGDQAVIYPAHGAGSVCGSGMAEREVSTIGYERRNNPRLRIDDRERFIAGKLAEVHLKPPYFAHMEALNLDGAPPMPEPLQPSPLTPAAFERLAPERLVLDVRSAAAYLGAHLPGSLAIPEDLLGAFAGWLLAPDQRLLLVAVDGPQALRAARRLARIGIDGVDGYLAPSLAAWAAGGGEFGSLPVVDARTVRERVGASPGDWTLLDVRGPEEVSARRIPGSSHVYVGELEGRLDELDAGRHYTVMCGSGARATIAASVLLRHGFPRVDLFLGSMGAWSHRAFETEGG